MIIIVLIIVLLSSFRKKIVTFDCYLGSMPTYFFFCKHTQFHSCFCLFEKAANKPIHRRNRSSMNHLSMLSRANEDNSSLKKIQVQNAVLTSWEYPNKRSKLAAQQKQSETKLINLHLFKSRVPWLVSQLRTPLEKSSHQAAFATQCVFKTTLHLSKIV